MRLSRVPGRRREGQRHHHFDPKCEDVRVKKMMITIKGRAIVHSRLRLMGLHDKATRPEHKTRIQAVKFNFWNEKFEEPVTTIHKSNALPLSVPRDPGSPFPRL